MILYFAGGGDDYRRILFEEGLNTILLTYADIQTENIYLSTKNKLEQLMEKAKNGPKIEEK